MPEIAMWKFCCLILITCFPLCSCSTSQVANQGQHQNVSTASHQIPTQEQDQFSDRQFDPKLLELLKTEQQIERPFAWQRWFNDKNKGSIVGIGKDGYLKTVLFEKTASGYTVKTPDYPHKLNRPIKQSGSLDLQDYITDEEFPFRSNILRTKNCLVHFVVSRRAIARSFQKHSLSLDGIDLRIIVEKHGQVVSNALVGLSSPQKGVGFPEFRDAFIRDINADGKQDYAIIVFDRPRHIFIWTVEDDCSIKPILFKEQDGRRFENISGINLFLTRDRSRGGHTIHVRWYEPAPTDKPKYDWEVTEEMYRWNKKEAVYEQVKEFSWLTR